MVLGGGIFSTSGPVVKFFPILETVPLVDPGSCAGELPPVIDTIGEAKTDGDF